MKIAVFSDIHGNLKALETVLERIKAQNADLTVFLGDIFQRGNEEFECLDLLKNSDVVCLKGNCELYAAYGVDIDPDVEHLRAYYDGIRAKISEEQLQFIRRMPLYYEDEFLGHKLHFSHFLFLDVDSPYPFPPLSSLKDGSFHEACKSQYIAGFELAAIGHSHQDFVNGNVVSVSAAGLEGASFLLINVDEKSVSYDRISLE